MNVPIVTAKALSSSDFGGAEEPFSLFAQWFQEAQASEPNDPETMALATIDADGMPDVRMVLCKDFDSDGFVFYSNEQSAKGGQLAARPKAALLFHWKSLRRQIRIRGSIGAASACESDAYFASRSRNSRIGAWASQQSRPLESRAALEAEFARYTQKFGAGDIPRPPHWRGFRLTPRTVEFWRDGANRLHDRMAFERVGNAAWTRTRLFP